MRVIFGSEDIQCAGRGVEKRIILGAGPISRPHSPAPLLQPPRQPTLCTLVQTAHSAETCTARPHVHMQRIIDTGPCFPLASAQISPTAKSARPVGSAARHDPTTDPKRGSQLNTLNLRFHEASSPKNRPLTPPSPQFPPAARGAKSKWETRPQGPRCSAFLPS